MNKIGILTYHRVVNDGSIMQTHCLQQTVKANFPGAIVEVIDYIPKKLVKTELKKIITKTPPFISLGAIQKITSVSTFIKQNIQLSAERCVTDNLEKAIEFIEKQKYDLVLVGSDTVWEARESNYVPAIPNAYYLPNYCGRKVSFAASSDPIKPEIATNIKYRSIIRQVVSNFDVISVRDEMTRDYLVDLGIKDDRTMFMPDPTFHYTFVHLAKINGLRKATDKPIVGIDLSGNINRNNIIEQCEKLGFAIMDINKKIFDGKKVKGLSKLVYSRLGIFSELDLLITDRFHSSIFTLQLSGSPVIFVESYDKWPMPNSKGRDLFQRLGISDMVWRYTGEIPNGQVETCLKEWDRLESTFKFKLSSLKSAAKQQFSEMIKYIDNQ